MSLGLHESRLRQRRQRRLRLFKWLFVLALLFGAGLFAYESGSMLARQEVVQLEQRIEELDATIGRLERDKRELQAALQEAKMREQRWRERYRAEVPQGTRKELLDLVQQRLQAGVRPERLAFVVSKVENERQCSGGPTSKRFIVQTPVSTGANGAVAFADGAITVTAEGRSATDDQGNPEAWYDPAHPVAVRFTQPGGRSSKASGKLPLHHSVVVDGREHRFSVVDAEARGFVKVTWQHCAYP